MAAAKPKQNPGGRPPGSKSKMKFPLRLRASIALMLHQKFGIGVTEAARAVVEFTHERTPDKRGWRGEDAGEVQSLSRAIYRLRKEPEKAVEFSLGLLVQVAGRLPKASEISRTAKAVIANNQEFRGALEKASLRGKR